MRVKLAKALGVDRRAENAGDVGRPSHVPPPADAGRVLAVPRVLGASGVEQGLGAGQKEGKVRV